MASKRLLKKEIVRTSGFFFDTAVLIRSFASQEQREAISNLIDELIVFTDDTLRRAHHPDGKDNKALVRAHYRTLRGDMTKFYTNLDERLDDFIEKL